MEVVTVGEALVCFTPTPGDDDLYVRSLGGAESNTAIGLTRLGHRVAWLSRVATDPLGDYVNATLRAEGIDLSYVIPDGSRPTGVMFKESVDPHLTQVYYYRAGSAASFLGPEDLPLDALRQARLVHLTGVAMAIGAGPQELGMRLIREARERGIPVSFDPNYRPQLLSPEEAREAHRRVLPLVTHLLCNETEALLIADVPTIDEAIAYLRAAGPTSVIVKRGVHGAIADIDGRRYELPAYPAPRPVDPVGAGDAFNAGWIHATLIGLDEIISLELAAYVAAQVVQHPGDYEGFPAEAVVDDWLAARVG